MIAERDNRIQGPAGGGSVVTGCVTLPGTRGRLPYIGAGRYLCRETLTVSSAR